MLCSTFVCSLRITYKLNRLFCKQRYFSSHSFVPQYFKRLLNEYEKFGSFQSLSDIKKENVRVLHKLLTSYHALHDNLIALNELKTGNSGDKPFLHLLEEEFNENENNIHVLENQIILMILSGNESSSYTDIMLEVSAGVGGQESMLFANDLFNMYCNYVQFRNWSYNTSDYELSSAGGLRQGCIFISGKDAFRLLMNEGGVHRVQRVPLTEKSGRMHTSTATVVILRQPSNIDIVLKDKDLRIETKTSTGPGGQRANKIETAVRVHHIPTQIIVECEVHRTQVENRKLALQKLRTKLYNIQMEERDQTLRTSRKLQTGNRFRNEKIRTYNYNQGRITDHRFGKTVHNLPVFLEGKTYFHEFITMLAEVAKENKITEFLQSLEKLENVV